MSQSRKKYDQEFKASAVRIVEESGRPIAQIARDLGVNEGTLGNWVAKARAANGKPVAEPHWFRDCQQEPKRAPVLGTEKCSTRRLKIRPVEGWFGGVLRSEP